MIKLDLWDIINANADDAVFFNTQHAEELAKAIREEVVSGDQAWRETVHIRWVQFQLGLLNSRIANQANYLGMLDVTRSKAMLIANGSQALIGMASELRQLSRFLSGLEKLPDPVECEVNMRLNEQAQAPAKTE